MASEDARLDALARAVLERLESLALEARLSIARGEQPAVVGSCESMEYMLIRAALAEATENSVAYRAGLEAAARVADERRDAYDRGRLVATDGKRTVARMAEATAIRDDIRALASKPVRVDEMSDRELNTLGYPRVARALLVIEEGE